MSEIRVSNKKSSTQVLEIFHGVQYKSILHTINVLGFIYLFYFFYEKSYYINREQHNEKYPVYDFPNVFFFFYFDT